jgi:8-hydroxy-5-deazaflavin:NADPH oxidoreductase
MKPKIGIIGKGRVGSALERGMQRAGYDVKTVGADPGAVRDTSQWAEIVILAAPFTAIDDVLREIGANADGKVLVDVTNALTSDYQLALGYSTSGAEELQKKVPRARIVKAFNMIFAAHMDTGRVKDQQLTVFAAGDDADAKHLVLELARDIGFDAVDAGPLRNARLLEPLGFLNIQLGSVLKMGTDIGFKLIH